MTDLTTQAHDSWNSLLRNGVGVINRVNVVLKKYDTSAQDYRTLDLLASGEMPMSTLADSLGRSRSMTSRLVERLEKRGFISRSTDPSDGRGVLVGLTADGDSFRIKIQKIHDETVALVFSDKLNSDALEALEEILDTL